MAQNGISGTGSPAGLGRLRIFPSPAVQGVFVEMPEAAGSELRLVVSNAQGQVVTTLAAQAAGQVWVERGDWPAGLYFLRLEDAVGQVRAAGKVVFAR